jgi:hypothetical protein
MLFVILYEEPSLNRDIRRHLRTVPVDGTALDPEREIGDLVSDPRSG